MTLIPSPSSTSDANEHLSSLVNATFSAHGVGELIPSWVASDTVSGKPFYLPPPGALPTESADYPLQKRALDLTLAVAALPFAGLALIAISLAVLVTSGFPIFYRQSRLGRHGRVFHIIKFRTMRNNAEEALAEFLLHHPEFREEWLRSHKIKGDPRITWLGRFLRTTSLDEVPQIFNVLRGEMSFVGPRPIVRAEVERYGEGFRYYASAVPGITGLWQVSGRSNLSYQERVEIDERYARTWSLRGDLKILARTPQAVLRRDGSC